MTTPEIDYRALFAAVPSPCLVLGPDLVIVDVNRAYLEVTGRARSELVGRRVIDTFPGAPEDPHADAVRNLDASLHRVLTSRETDTMAPQRYDVPIPDRPGAFEERWWSPINVPVLGPDGTVAWIIHRVEDMTDFIHARLYRHGPAGDLDERHRGAEAELYARAQELQRLNEELRKAHAQQRQVALTLQESMLHSPALPRHKDIAVRYLPAVETLNVCGDWYDVADVSTGRFAAAVGDVAGHGLEAAGVMGMLRSALSAAMLVTNAPARALQILGLYASSIEGALATTAVKVLVDTNARLITYSSAGHLPPVLLHADGTCELLDQATDPPLAARPEPQHRSEAGVSYVHGDSLVLYTDGLIERRGEDIDAGLARLTEALSHYAELGSEQLADALLAHLGVSGGARDDIALVVIRL